MAKNDRPVHVGMATDVEFKAIMKKTDLLRWEGIRNGFATGADPDGQIVVRAIRKGGDGQPWIVSYYNSLMVTWKTEGIANAGGSEK